MKDFIPYEEALELKHLGFDERCLGKFVKHYNQIERILNSDDFDNWWTENSEDLNVPSPMFSQAFRWFREKYDLHSYIEGAYPWFRFYINSEDDRWEGHKEMTYEEAELACLKKLIELVKQKQ